MIFGLFLRFKKTGVTPFAQAGPCELFLISLNVNKIQSKNKLKNLGTYYFRFGRIMCGYYLENPVLLTEFSMFKLAFLASIDDRISGSKQLF
jgi:hypothetical protein